MKLFLKILAGLFTFLLILILALNLYFTDERLKRLVQPHLNEAAGREVQIDRMSLTFFRTFPQAGIQLDGFMLPDDEGEPLIDMQQMVAAVKVFPLLRNEINVTRLELYSPRVFYTVYEDSTTNFDSLLETEEPPAEEEQSAYSIQIPNIELRDAALRYRDGLTRTRADLDGLDAEIGLVFAGLIESKADVRLQSLSFFRDETRYVNNLSLQLQQSSIIDLNEEILTLEEGTFSIRGLALNLSGSVSRWSSDAPELDLAFSSASDNFGELLGLAPPELSEHLQGLETRGTLALDGSITGSYRQDQFPRFDFTLNVNEGFIQNPDLQEPIQNISFFLSANNDRLALERFSARAAGNRIEATGILDRPLDEDAPFSLEVNGDVDLGTVSQFIPLADFDIEELAGAMDVNATANGNLQNPDQATFQGTFVLKNGLLKYAGVPHAIEDITADVDANQNLTQIRSASFRAVSNRFTMSGSISNPLEDHPNLDIRANLDFDLATLKEFYPIDEDTLMLRGRLKADAVFRGPADPIQQALQQSTIEFRNGYIAHHLVGKPLEEITFLASATGRQLTIREGRFRTGNNSISMNGTVDNYWDEDPVFDLNLNGTALLSDATDYYSIEPWINELNGNAVMNLRAKGPAGDPLQIALNGSMEVSDVSAYGDSLGLPITGLRGKLAITPQAMTIEGFTMNYGSSDFAVDGRLQNYLGFLQENTTPATMPALSGTYRGRLFNLDEMIDWEDDTETTYPITLPNMNSTVTANIDTLRMVGVSITHLRGSGRTTPDQILIDEAEANIFGGQAIGRLTWNVPEPAHTNLRFQGDLQGVQASALFREFPILGPNSRFEKHVTGAFNAKVDYQTDLDVYFNPSIENTHAKGNFGMSRARLQGHPLQVHLADWLRADGLKSLAMDEWQASFEIQNAVLSLSDFRLTSENIGMELEGTQNLVTDEIDFTAQLFLPPRFRNGIESIISSRAVEALTRDDGIIVVPIRITGTMGSPRISPRQTIIENLLKDTLQDAGKKALERLFNRN
ncbi:MAG: AsmA-like C-terminal region-containing protein [Balneolaceae bacterium]